MNRLLPLICMLLAACSATPIPRDPPATANPPGLLHQWLQGPYRSGVQASADSDYADVSLQAVSILPQRVRTFGEPFGETVDIGAFEATCQLSVAEASCASLAEQIVILAIEVSSAIELTHGVNAILYRLAPFENQWPIPLQSEIVSRHQSRGSGTDDDRPL